MRASWDEYFMQLATAVATRATCDRKHVGAVFVRDRTVLATGYNGSMRGQPHCDDAGHLMENGHCVRTVHAEANAIVQAAKHGVRLEGSELYVTAAPCRGCCSMIVNAGVKRVTYGENYRSDHLLDLAMSCGVTLVYLPVKS